MPYRFKRNEKLEAGLHRIAAEQLDDLLTELDNERLSIGVRIHSARKLGKKIRGLLRLVRPGLARATYRAESESIRNASRLLSAARDAQTMTTAFDRLTEKSADRAAEANGAAHSVPNFEPIRQRLLQREQDAIGERSDLRGRIAEFRDSIAAMRKRVDDWRLKGDAAKIVRRGFKNTYASAQQALARACDEDAPEAFHEWRRRAKDHWCHLLLLEKLWPPVLTSHSSRVDELAGLLGEDHDLAVLADTLRAAPDEFGLAEPVEALLALAVKRQEQLRTKAKKLGADLFQAKPKRLAQPLAALLR